MTSSVHSPVGDLRRTSSPEGDATQFESLLSESFDGGT